MCGSCLASFGVSLIGGCRVGMSMGGGEFRILIHCPLEPDPLWLSRNYVQVGPWIPSMSNLGCNPVCMGWREFRFLTLPDYHLISYGPIFSSYSTGCSIEREATCLEENYRFPIVFHLFL